MQTDGGEVEVQESRSEIETERNVGRDRNHKEKRENSRSCVLLRNLDFCGVIFVL